MGEWCVDRRPIHTNILLLGFRESYDRLTGEILYFKSHEVRTYYYLKDSCACARGGFEHAAFLRRQIRSNPANPNSPKKEKVNVCLEPRLPCIPAEPPSADRRSKKGCSVSPSPVSYPRSPALPYPPLAGKVAQPQMARCVTLLLKHSVAH